MNNSLNITIDSDESNFLSESHIFEVVIGTGTSAPDTPDTMASGSSDNGSVGSNGSSLLKNRRSTVDMILKIVPDFSGDMGDNLLSYIEDCELALSLTSEEHLDLFLITIKKKLHGPAKELIKFEPVSSWEN